ncbi:MAG: IS110 family RNA-guided transposase [Planctomycetota bacterium]
MNILALDLGKSKTVVCFYDSKNGKHKFGKVKTTPKKIHDLLVEYSPGRVVFEICSAAGWVYDIAKALGFEVEAANPNTQAWRWKNVKRKNDRDDALKLAQLSAMDQLPMVHIPKTTVRQKRGLIQYRQRLVSRVVQIKNSIRSILDGQGYLMAPGKNGWSKKSLAGLRQMALSMEECGFDNLWRGQLRVELDMLQAAEKCLAEVTLKLDKLAKGDKQIQLLQTAAGVGPRLAEAIAAFIDEPKRFKSGKQVGCYAGLTPKQYQSGSMDRQGHISGQGNKLLRALLVEVSWLGLRHNSWIRETYERLLRGSPSRKKIAITAVARKLLVRCWAMLRDERPWRDLEIEQEKCVA